MHHCHTKRHTWTDPASASRCCDPGWRRELRMPGAPFEDDADDGAIYISGGMRLVWVRVEKQEACA